MNLHFSENFDDRPASNEIVSNEVDIDIAENLAKVNSMLLIKEVTLLISRMDNLALRIFSKHHSKSPRLMSQMKWAISAQNVGFNKIFNRSKDIAHIMALAE